MNTYAYIVDGVVVIQNSPSTWQEIRAHRDALLLESDWTQMPDSPLSSEGKALWLAYRQRLRDLPNVYATPDDVAWPIKPEV